MYYVYVLKSESYEKYYVGMTESLQDRLERHNAGGVKSTKGFTPWKIIHFEQYDTSLLARSREKYLKSSAGRRWRKNNLGD